MTKKQITLSQLAHL